MQSRSHPVWQDRGAADNDLRKIDAAYDSESVSARQADAIKVLEIRRLNNAGNLKAFAKVSLGCVVVNGCRIIQQTGQKAWVAMPQQKSGDKWYPVVEITRREVLDQVRVAILDAWERGP